MGKRRFDKWLTNLRPEDTLDVVLAKSLRSRIDAVCHYLPLAAEHFDEDVEYVHLLRVWSRRSVAVLRLYRTVLPKKRAKRLRKRLRQVRAAAGSARDYDVLLQRHEPDDRDPHAARFFQQLSRERRAAQEPICRISRKLRRGKELRHAVEKLHQSLNRKRGAQLVQKRFSDWSREPLRRLVTRFQCAAPADPTDLAALHRFRIRGKQLRYGIELLAPAFPAALSEQVYPNLQNLQEQLGQLNDRAVAVRRLNRWIQAERDPRSRLHLQELLNREHESQDQLIREIESWWSSQQLEELLRTISEFVAPSKSE